MAKSIDELMAEWSGSTVQNKKRTTPQRAMSVVDLMDEYNAPDPTYKPKTFIERIYENPIMQFFNRPPAENRGPVLPSLLSGESQPELMPNSQQNFAAALSNAMAGHVGKLSIPEEEQRQNREAAKQLGENIAYLAQHPLKAVEAVNKGLEVGVHSTMGQLTKIMELPFEVFGKQNVSIIYIKVYP